MKISITRALAELKLTDKKINQKINELTPAYALKKEGVEEGTEDIKRQAEKLQSIQDLINRRANIKREIVLSNAAATVTIAGKNMTVADAIERKTSIQFNKDLQRKLREGYYSAVQNAERHNDQVDQNADKQAQAALQSEGEKGAAYEAVRRVFVDNNKAELIAISDVENTIEKIQDDIDNFEMEVDFILSESNTKTMIEV